MKFRVLLFLCVLGPPLAADEGMWLCNQFPAAQVKQKYDFDVTPAFLDKLRLACASAMDPDPSSPLPD